MSDFNFRRLVIALLGLNTFLLCGLAGAGFFYLRHEAVPTITRLPLAGEQLTKDDRDALQLALNNARKTVRQQSLDARQARIDAAALMGEPTLDTVALSNALDRARDAEYSVRNATEAAAVDFARTLPLDARRRLAQGLLGREAPKSATK